MTWIKICGVTNPEDAIASVEAGADALGFVFHPASPRMIDPDRACTIIDRLPQSIEKIGVFVNEPPEQVSRIADQVRLTAVQFHGDEYEDTSRLVVNRRILLSVPFSSFAGNGQEGAKMWISLAPIADNLMAIMIDSGSKEHRGGTGRTFDWQSAAASISALEKRHPVVIAGGLTPENVSEAIALLHPWGVDVSSGVEANPGKKDAERVRAFIKAVRLADQRNVNH